MIARTLLSRVFISSIILAVALLFGFLGMQVTSNVLPAKEAYDTESLIRLHILANSDLPSDQELKLQVRDAILAKTQHLFAGSANKAEAWQELIDHEDVIRSIAQEVVWEAGQEHPVEIRLGRYDFPERSYGSLTVPAGDYHAVQVVIGAGRGQNWWCVLFPPLCLMEAAGTEPVIREPNDVDPEKQAMVHWRLKYLDGIYKEYSGKLASFLDQGLGLRFLSTAQLQARSLLPQ
ncbi:MAG: stage II sporulation protein R [Firmicutes bacterium]|nr:stage II sporulation protein R [Bacillota bacterium]